MLEKYLVEDATIKYDDDYGFIPNYGVIKKVRKVTVLLNDGTIVNKRNIVKVV